MLGLRERELEIGKEDGIELEIEREGGIELQTLGRLGVPCSRLLCLRWP